jgi:hypothetical protein
MLISRRAPDEDDRRAGSAPDTDRSDEQPTDVARQVLAPAGSPEEKLERLLAEHRRDVEEHARRFEDAMADLERREAQLRDMRSSVDRLLRLGTSDLSERELELQELGREFMEREARLSADETELNRRRTELGAVELKREAIEQRERALATREAELDARDAGRLDPPSSHHGPAAAAREDDVQPPVALVFLAGPAYRLVAIEPRPLEPGASLDVDGEAFVVQRLGPSPLPADRRRCAYLVRGGSGDSASGGSS